MSHTAMSYGTGMISLSRSVCSVRIVDRWQANAKKKATGTVTLEIRFDDVDVHALHPPLPKLANAVLSGTVVHAASVGASLVRGKKCRCVVRCGKEVARTTELDPKSPEGLVWGEKFLLGNTAGLGGATEVRVELVDGKKCVGVATVPLFDLLSLPETSCGASSVPLRDPTTRAARVERSPNAPEH